LVALGRRLRLLPVPDAQVQQRVDSDAASAAPPSKKRSRGADVVPSSVPSPTERPLDSLVPQPSAAVLSEAAAAGTGDRSLVLDVVLSHHEGRESDLSTINRLSLYPDEKLLWDPSRVPGRSDNDMAEGPSVLSVALYHKAPVNTRGASGFVQETTLETAGLCCRCRSSISSF
jgi:hypothetical protein